MNKLLLMRNPIVFQGERYLNKSKNYFEGWYFKNTNGKETISFIPGITIHNKEQKAFIQIITNTTSYYVDYDINEFKYTYNPFSIKIGNNYFSRDKIHIDITDSKNEIFINGDLIYSNIKNIKTNFFKPNIMGPFSYIPFMECNHAILTMKSNASGAITINNQKIIFENGTGYIEKDWGISFPKAYVWLEGNNFQNNNASFMLSVANIPFKIFDFTGIICALIIGDKEYKFTTYNHTKIIKYDIDNDQIDIILKKKDYYLRIQSISNTSQKLIAPVKGKMTKNILESISSKITVTLKKKEQIIFNDTSSNCGLEIVQ